MSLFKTKFFPSVIIFLFIIIASCDISKNRVDLTLYEVERNQKALRKVTDFELVEQGYLSGKLLADSSEAYFWATITAAIDENDSIFSCNQVIFPDQKGSFAIKLLGKSKSEDQGYPALVLKSYLQQDQPKTASLEAINKQQYLYTKPLWYDEQKCLTCHRLSDKENANLAGVWSVELSRKYLVLKIPAVND